MSVDARTIEPGQCWRKKTGEFVYLAISESAKNFHGLDADKLYGVCFNGNMAAVSYGVEVEPMPTSAMDDNRKALRTWEDLVGVRHE